MKVLFLVAYIDNYRHMNTFIYSQGEALRKIGIDIEYFFLKGPGFTKYLKGIFDLNGYIKKHHLDLIHAHYSYNGYVATFQNQYPVVVSFMGTDLLENPGIVKKMANRIINRKIFRRAAKVIVKSIEMKKIIDNELVELLPNGVDTEVFFPIDKAEARSKLNLTQVKKYILFAADPQIKVKNYELACRAFNEIRNKDIELLTVYNKSQEELNLYFNACNVLLFTSFYEGSPNIIKEAMAANTPIVAVNVGDAGDRLSEVVNCYLCTHNHTELARNILNAIENQSRSNGRDILIKQGLDSGNISKRLKKIYEAVITENILHREYK